MGRVHTVIYLDNAATTLKKPFGMYLSLLKNTVKNSANAGRGGHFYSLKAAEGIYETTEALCELFNIITPERLVYTYNATYGINMAILGCLEPGDHVIITQLEHNSVLRPVNRLCDYSIIKADGEGRINVNDIEKEIKSNTKMIISTHASNVCGTIMPIDKISKLAHDNNLYFMVDASQSAGSIPIDVEETKIDILALSGHKGLMMPMGTGILYVGENVRIKPVITGGTGSLSESIEQPEYFPDILQSGTQNVPAIIAGKESIKFILKHTPKAIGEKERYLAQKVIDNLMNMGKVKVYGVKNGIDRNGTVAFNIEGMDSVNVSQILNDEYGICTRGGWHCAYQSHIALGTQKIGAVRASFGYFNSLSDVEKLTGAIKKITKK